MGYPLGNTDGVMEFTVRCRRVINGDSGIRKFGYFVTMSIEMRLIVYLKLELLVLDDE